MMEDFEKKLKDIALREPSVALDRRIMDARPQQAGFGTLFHQRISLAWAAAFSIITGLLGFVLATLWFTGASPTTPPGTIRPTGKEAVQVQIIYQSPESRPVFDFTETGTEFLPGEIDVKVSSDREEIL
jgi:hypothetical protein